MLRQSSSRESESRWEEGFAKTDSGVFSWERLSTLVATSMRDYESSSPPVAPLSLDLMTLTVGLCWEAQELSQPTCSSRRLQAETSAQANPAKLVAQPGALNLTLTALSPSILRISISPMNDAPRLAELGVVSQQGKELAGPGQVNPGTILWGKYSLKISEGPLHVAAYESGQLRQEIRSTWTARTSASTSQVLPSAWEKASIPLTAVARGTTWSTASTPLTSKPLVHAPHTVGDQP